MGGVEEESQGGGGRFWGAPPDGAISHSAPLIFSPNSRAHEGIFVIWMRYKGIINTYLSRYAIYQNMYLILNFNL
jgi:hypothetical protein